MVFLFGVPPPAFYLRILMLIGLVVQMIGDPRGDYAIFYEPNLIAWSARKHAIVSRSST
jgi:hypothetical protein